MKFTRFLDFLLVAPDEEHNTSLSAKLVPIYPQSTDGFGTESLAGGEARIEPIRGAESIFHKFIILQVFPVRPKGSACQAFSMEYCMDLSAKSYWTLLPSREFRYP